MAAATVRSKVVILFLLFLGLFPATLVKGPWPKLGKMIDITAKLREINDIEHNKGSKIYLQNQVIFDCIMPTIPLKHKCSRSHSTNAFSYIV